MRDAPLTAGHGDLAAASLAACVETILEVGQAPGEEAALGPWLARQGLGFVPVAEAAAFAWAGPWIARVRAVDGRVGHVVRYGAPSGTVADPGGLGADAAPEAGWVLAALDPLRGRRRVDAAAAVDGVVTAIALAERREGPARLVAAAEAIPGRGLAGDRYAVGAGTFPSPGDGSALTLVEAEVIESFAPALTASEHRRNVVTRGVDLDALVGRRFTLGAVLCEGRRPDEPCAHLERLASRPLLRALVHRGGLRADLLSAGTIRVGDPIRAV